MMIDKRVNSNRSDGSCGGTGVFHASAPVGDLVGKLRSFGVSIKAYQSLAKGPLRPNPEKRRLVFRGLLSRSGIKFFSLVPDPLLKMK